VACGYPTLDLKFWTCPTSSLVVGFRGWELAVLFCGTNTVFFSVDGYWFNCYILWECVVGVCCDGGTGCYGGGCEGKTH
jgi:hypothetical protein